MSAVQYARQYTPNATWGIPPNTRFYSALRVRARAGANPFGTRGTAVWYNPGMERTFKYVLTGDEWTAWNHVDTRERRQAQNDILTRAESMAMRADFDFVAYYSPHEDHLGITTLRDV